MATQTIDTDPPIILTIEHAASCYGLPVALIEDVPHGPNDSPERFVYLADGSLPLGPLSYIVRLSGASGPLVDAFLSQDAPR